MRILRVAAALFPLTAALFAQTSFAQTSGPPEKIDVSKRGPQVGDRIPDFSLPDQNGKLWTQRSIMGPKGAMLVFVRSADWCPYCKTQLVELQSQVAELKSRGLGLATISYDPVKIVSGFAAQHSITFPMLSDAGSAAIRRFGLVNPVAEWAQDASLKDNPAVQEDVRRYVSVVRPGANMIGMAFPGTFILGPDGSVKQRFFEDFYVERNTVSSLLLKLGGNTGATVAATRVSASHLDLTAYPSIAAIAPGDRFSLVLDIVPQPGIHVYAPGAQSYRVVSLKLDPAPEFRVLPPQYPASSIYFYKPLNERVPVFQKPFRLLQELVLIGTTQAQAALRGRDSVTVKGTLEYQACSEKECYNPVSVPLSWTMSLRPLVFGQPGAPAPPGR